MRRKRIVLPLIAALLFTSVPVKAETYGGDVQEEAFTVAAEGNLTQEVILTEEGRYNPVYYQEPEALYPKRSVRSERAQLTLEEYIVNALSDVEHLPKEIDVSAYKIPFDRETASETYFQILNNNPELFYVKSSASWSYNSQGYVVAYKITYAIPEEEIPTKLAELRQAADQAVAQVDGSLSDIEKALAVHDYLTVYCEYDNDRLEAGTLPDISHTAYGSLVNRMAVCDGYADAFTYIMKDRFGVDCTVVSSGEMAHAWNMISIDGKWYHVDVTWDDPVLDCIGRVRHNYFLLSDAAISDASHRHTGWVTDKAANSTTYDSAFWTEISSAIIPYQGAWYHSKFDGEIGQVQLVKKPSLFSTSETVVDTSGLWGGKQGYYGASFMYLYKANNRIYYNKASEICRLDSSGATATVYRPSIPEEHCIYGFTVRGDQLCYAIQNTPNLATKQEVKTHTLAELVEPELLEITGVSASDVNAVYDGKAKQIQVTGTKAGDVVTYALEGGAYGVSQPEMKNAGTYRVLYRVERNGYKPYNGSASVAITKAVPTYTKPSGLKGSSGQTLGSVKLPAGFSWETSATTRLYQEGKHTYRVKYVPSDTKNYQEVPGIEVEVTVTCPGHQYDSVVTKEPTLTEEGVRTYTCKLCGDSYTETIDKLVPSEIEGIHAENVNTVYDGQAKQIQVTGTKSGDIVTYALEGGAYSASQPRMVDAGTYRVQYRVERSGYKTYNGSVSVTIAKAVPSYTIPAGLKGNSGQTLGSVALPRNFVWQTQADTRFFQEGTFTYLVKYVPTDSKNYQEVLDIEVAVTVSCPGHAYESEVTKEPTPEQPGEIVYTCKRCGNSYKEEIEYQDPEKPVITNIQAKDVNAVYDGSAKAIQVEGTQEGDVISYAGEDGNYKAIQPEMKNAGTYRVFFRVERQGYQTYQGSASVTIQKATPQYTVPAGLKGTSGKALSDVTLPAGFQWQTENISFVQEGMYTYLVKYIPEDRENYEEALNIEVQVEVSCPGHRYDAAVTKEPTTAEPGERTYTCSICEDTYTEEIPKLDPALPALENIHAEDVQAVYDGSSKKITIQGVQEGDTVLYAGADGIYGNEQPQMADAGVYQVSYRVERNGYQPFTGTANVEIQKAVPAYQVPAGLKGSSGAQLGSVGLPQGFQWQEPESTRFTKEGTFQYHVTYTPEDIKNYKVVQGIAVSVQVSCPGHKYDSKVTRQPTATQKGIQAFTCKICGDAYTKELPMLAPQKPGALSGLKVSKAAVDSLKFTWKKTNGVSYRLVLYKGNKKISEKTTSSSSYTFKKLSAASVYTLKVTPYKNWQGKKLYAAKTSSAKAVTAPAKPKLSSVKKSGSGKCKLTWKKVMGASGYEIYQKTGNGKYKKVKTLTSGSKTSLTKSGMKKGKTYTFKIRAYKKNGSQKVYSAYSSTKKIKFK